MKTSTKIAIESKTKDMELLFRKFQNLRQEAAEAKEQSDKLRLEIAHLKCEYEVGERVLLTPSEHSDNNEVVIFDGFIQKHGFFYTMVKRLTISGKPYKKPTETKLSKLSKLHGNATK